jgi:FAD/FMN-containing dehydrogenase
MAGSTTLDKLTSLGTAKIKQLAATISGELVLPADNSYESARRVWNWAIDLHPAMIVRCANREDVLRTVDFARNKDLLVAVRAGGHSYAGHSTCEGGIVIDLSPMSAVHVDADNRIAYAQAGVTNGEFDARTQSYGLATPLGACAATGIAGLTLGGGLGWLGAKQEPHAITCWLLR